jgi:hypothetical protein
MGYIVLNQISEKEFVGEGDVVWHNVQDVYLTLNPEHKPIFVEDTDFANVSSAITITSVTDTLLLRSSQTTEQLTWVIIGFTVIMLQPILAVLFPEGNPEGKKK